MNHKFALSHVHLSVCVQIHMPSSFDPSMDRRVRMLGKRQLCTGVLTYEETGFSGKTFFY